MQYIMAKANMLPDSRIIFERLSAWYLELEKVFALKSYWRIETPPGTLNKALGDLVVTDINLCKPFPFPAAPKAGF